MVGITGDDNFFEDFTVGMRFRHARGKTITELENVLITNLVMNTADAHFNESRMESHPLGQSIVFGGITASLVAGLASQDTADSLIEDRGIANLKLLAPVVHGDTIHAATEVTGVEPFDAHSGLLTLHHWGYNQRNEIVAEFDRVIRVPRKPKTKQIDTRKGQA